MSPDIVITGIGAVGSFGSSPDDLWNALLCGEPLDRPSKRLSGDWLSTEMVDFDLDKFRRTAKGHRAPRISQYALAAAAQAISQANITAKSVDKDAVSIVYGTGNGPGDVIAKNLAAITDVGMGGIEPLSFQESVFNAPASLISIEYGFRGPLIALPMGWAAGGYAVSTAADLIEFGHASIAVVVVSDELTSLTHNAVSALGLVSPNDGLEQMTRPFDRRHNGAVMGEGGAALVLETREHAMARGATVLMELAGWGVTSDAFGVGHKGAGPAALQSAMEIAMHRAGEDRPDLVYSGSYCTADADQAEANSLVAIFEPSLRPTVTNIRGTIGEAKGVSGIFNLIAAEASLRTGIVPRTSGCEDIDLGCPIDIATKSSAIADMDVVMCNAFWVNGTNTSIIVRKSK